MPYPQNLTVARELEAIVRKKGAVPATIAVMDGVPCIGLTDDQLQTLAKEQKSVVKASTRDLAYVIASKKTGATTVAATMRLAHLAGVQVFATGGLGGVHRGGESTMDISTDLVELGRTPVAVVCAGIKSILDVQRSLEVLETQGVPVVGYQTDTFPAFFTNESGIKVHARADTAEEAANLLRVQFQVADNVGAVIAVPNPHPANSAQVSGAIDQALKEADEQHVTGNAITPFLLQRIEQLTQGQSLHANIALVKHNVETACDIALHMQQLQQQQQLVDAHATTCSKHLKDEFVPKRDVVVVGGATVDIIASVSIPDAAPSTKASSDNHIQSVDGSAMSGDMHINGVYHAGASNPGVVRQSFGGVGRNVASHLARHGISTILLSCWASDASGQALDMDCQRRCRIDTSRVSVLSPPVIASSGASVRTAVYNAIHRADGDLIAGVADMDIFRHITPQYLLEQERVLEGCRAIVCDANVTVDAFQSVADYARTLRKPLFFEPTSDHKCVLPLKAQRLQEIAVLKPNASELQCMMRYALDHCAQDYPHMVWTNIDILLREAESEFCCSSMRRHDVETLALLSAMMIDLMNTIPVSMCSHRHHHSQPQYISPAKDSRASDLVVVHKHVLVSLGEQGLLWTAPKAHFEGLYGGGALIKDGLQLRVPGFDLRTHMLTPQYLSVHVVGDPLTPEQVISSNGAGDALFAAVIRSMLNQQQQQQLDGEQGNSNSGKSSSSSLRPNVEDILAGMRAARNRLFGQDEDSVLTDLRSEEELSLP